MANTYTQLYVQIIFAVKGRQNMISEKHRVEVEQYICGIVKKYKSKPLAIYCNPDHIHILIGFHPTISIANISKLIKSNSSKWINQKSWMPFKFEWQRGYGAFTYSKTQIDSVSRHILNQPIHHKKTSFREEYLNILDRSDISFDEQYLFNWYN